MYAFVSQILNSVRCFLGAGAVDYIVNHAEIDFVFVQNTKIKRVKIFEISFISFLYIPLKIDLFIDLYMLLKFSCLSRIAQVQNDLKL